MSNYYLLQTGDIKSKKESDNTILTHTRWDYMGSAEFEFGALPKALANLLSSDEEKVFGKIEVTVNEATLGFIGDIVTETVLFRYYVRKSQVNKLEELLTNITARNKKSKFKEVVRILDKENPIIFGIDKDIEFLAWTKKSYTSKFKEDLDNTYNVLKENDWIE